LKTLTIVKKYGKELKKLLILNHRLAQNKLRLDDCEITDSVEVANAFNSYFSSMVMT